MNPTAAPAQVTFTTSVFTSPAVIGAVVTLLASILSASGVHVLDDPAVQQQAILVIGIMMTALAHYLWPNKDGRLALSAPFSTPAPQDLQAGSSVVSVPAPADQVQATSVTPLPAETVHVVEVATPMAAVNFPADGPALPTVTVTPHEITEPPSARGKRK